MDLIYCDLQKTELGILRKFALDFEISAKKGNNNFELEVSIDSNIMQNGCYFYAENTEIGGIVDSTKIDTAKDSIYYSGRTWRGILESKIIQPEVGEDYVIVSGDANDIIDGLLTKYELDGLFKVEDEESGLELTDYQFDRYVDMYSALIKMLSQNGYKLTLQHKIDGFVYISAVPITDYGEYQEVTSHLFDFKVTKRKPTVNHLIGLGSGELKDRLVVHRYLNENNQVSAYQYYFGIDEIVDIYDMPNSEELEQLISDTENQLLEYAVEDGIEISNQELNAEIGDRFVVYEAITKTEIAQFVTNVIVNIDEDSEKIQYKIGDGLI